MMSSTESYNPFSLKDKNILITGASSGIGRQIALECVKMGAKVFFTARNEDRLQELLKSMPDTESSNYIVADITDEEGRNKITNEVGYLDGVVHCAGIGDRTLCKMIREADLHRVMKVNFEAPVLLQKALLKKKKINKGASIVFIASRAPFAPTIGNSLYSASKAALIAYSKVLGLELANQSIRVNCICPAMVWTDLIRRDAELTGVDYHEEEKKYPLQRYGTPDDIAYLSVYLLSNTSSWMTGSCIDITGGANSL